MSVAKRAATTVGATFLKTFTDSNGCQGTDYHLFVKNGKFGISSVAFGTCSHCDWYQRLVEEYREANPDWWDKHMPDSVLQPIVNSIVGDLQQWYTVEEFVNNKHMIFGVGYSEEKIESQVLQFIKDYKA